MKKDFELFKKEFTRYQKLFGLVGYKVYFKYEPLDCFASIEVDGMVATVVLASEVSPEHEPFNDIKLSAKHEAIHLLINRLERLARRRYTTPDEITDASEELTVKLEGLI